jgi:hypothetical protein
LNNYFSKEFEIAASSLGLRVDVSELDGLGFGIGSETKTKKEEVNLNIVYFCFWHSRSKPKGFDK